MTKVPVPPWTLPLPPAVRWLQLLGPFVGTVWSPPKRWTMTQRPLVLRWRCERVVLVTVEYRWRGTWEDGEQAEAADAATTVAPAGPVTLRLRVDSGEQVHGVAELVEA